MDTRILNGPILLGSILYPKLVTPGRPEDVAKRLRQDAFGSKLKGLVNRPVFEKDMVPPAIGLVGRGKTGLDTICGDKRLVVFDGTQNSTPGATRLAIQLRPLALATLEVFTRIFLGVTDHQEVGR